MSLEDNTIFGGKGEKDYWNKRATFPQLTRFIHSFQQVIHRKWSFEPGNDLSATLSGGEIKIIKST